MNLAVCLIVKDEARDIAEWLAYYAVAGVDTFLIYDNGSSDGTISVLRAAAAVLDVRVVPWRSTSGQAQMEAYRHALRTNRAEFDWMAFIDVDEYIVTHGPHTLRSLCETDAAAVGVHWAMFGSNGHAELPAGLLIEAFTRRAELWFPAHWHVKSLVRPAAMPQCLNPHAFDVDGTSILPDGQALDWRRDGDGRRVAGLTQAPPDFRIAQVNHYFTRSRAHWSLKTVRSYPNASSRPKLREFDVYDRNEVEDTSAQRAVAAVRALRAEILGRVAAPAGCADVSAAAAVLADGWRRPRRNALEGSLTQA